MVEIDCKNIIQPCPQQNRSQTGSGNEGTPLFTSDSSDSRKDDKAPCLNTDNLGLVNFPNNNPEGLGTSPDCVQAAKIVLDAVIADAFSAKSTEPVTFSSIIKQTINNTGVS
jgi:hypothetical protein